jgi:hypothetical protein
MSKDETVYDDVIRRFNSDGYAEEGDESDSDESVDPNAENYEQLMYKKQTNRLKLSRAQRSEFILAFEIVAGENVQTVPSDKIYDIFLAMGFTFQDEDIEE